MFRAIPKQTIVASIVQNNNIIATGLGILDRNELGIYAINTHQNFRGKHYARAICTALLNHGITCGAKYGYLQVVKNNQPAISLYESLGFHYDYSYWFRSKPWDKL